MLGGQHNLDRKICREALNGDAAAQWESFGPLKCALERFRWKVFNYVYFYHKRKTVKNN
jgi:hypothetical protein